MPHPICSKNITPTLRFKVHCIPHKKENIASCIHKYLMIIPELVLFNFLQVSLRISTDMFKTKVGYSNPINVFQPYE